MCSYSNGTIFDFLLTGNVSQDDSVSVYFSSLMEVHWPWDVFFCSFQVSPILLLWFNVNVKASLSMPQQPPVGQ